MTQTEKMPLTISISDYAHREAEKKIDALGLTDTKQVRQRMTPEYERIRDQVGKQIMTGTLRAYTLKAGLPERLDVTASVKHPLLVELAAWLEGHRYHPTARRNVMQSAYMNNGWITGLHIEDVDIAAELKAAKARIAELESLLAKGGNDLPDNERKKLLKIVLGMAMGAYRYDPHAKREEVTGKGPGSIYNDLSNHNLATDPDYIRACLKEAANTLLEGGNPPQAKVKD